MEASGARHPSLVDDAHRMDSLFGVDNIPQNIWIDEAGAILARIPPEGRRPLRGYARDIGLAFQIADDIMDVEGDEALAGKALHKDAAAGKATFVTLMGLERAREQATLLVEQGIQHLAGFGEEAALLRAIARYVVERDR